MQVTINISEEIVQVAQSRGQSPEVYAEQLVSESIKRQSERMKKVDRFLREFPISGLPSLPDHALSRESIYSDDE